MAVGDLRQLGRLAFDFIVINRQVLPAFKFSPCFDDIVDLIKLEQLPLDDFTRMVDRRLGAKGRIQLQPTPRVVVEGFIAQDAVALLQGAPY
ncbi:hypothetical protein D3C76_1423460 [compost metagenome]